MTRVFVIMSEVLSCKCLEFSELCSLQDPVLQLVSNTLIAMLRFYLNLHAFNKLILLISLLGTQAKTFLVCKTEIRSVFPKDMQLELGKTGLKFSKQWLSFVLQQLNNTVYTVPITNMKYKHKIEKKKIRQINFSSLMFSLMLEIKHLKKCVFSCLFLALCG